MHINLILLLMIILIMCINTGQCLSNGNETVADDFKYQTYVKNEVFMSCSGVIIDEWHILTAAHCVYRNAPHQLHVLAGSALLVRNLVNIHEVQEIHVHHDYDISSISTFEEAMQSWPYHRADDIAILTLETPLLLGPHIGKAELPSQDVMPCASAQCVVSGWNVHRAEANEYVHSSWSPVTVEPEFFCELFDITIRENELCVTDIQELVTLHNVDTGGGVVCDGVLVGIIITGHNPIVSANVYAFLSFINEIKEKDQVLNSFLSSSSP